HLLWVAGQATLVVRNSVIEHFFSNGVFADSMSAGLAVYESTIRGGRTGVYAQAAAGATLMDNLLVSNVYPVCQGGVDIVYHGNEFVDNTWQPIAVSGTLNASCEWEDVQGLGMPYLVIGDTTIPEGRTLSIDPGI